MTHGRREDPGAGEAPRFPAWAPSALSSSGEASLSSGCLHFYTV